MRNPSYIMPTVYMHWHYTTSTYPMLSVDVDSMLEYLQGSVECMVHVAQAYMWANFHCVVWVVWVTKDELVYHK